MRDHKRRGHLKEVILRSANLADGGELSEITVTSDFNVEASYEVSHAQAALLIPFVGKRVEVTVDIAVEPMDPPNAHD